MKHLIPFSLFLPLLLAACATTRHAPGNLPEDRLSFGSGSRFSGISDTYVLLRNGQVFRQLSTDSTMRELKPLSRREVAEIFRKADYLQLFKLDVDQPGNLFYFIEQADKTASSRVTWGSGSYLPPQGLVFLYRDFLAIVKGREENMALKAGKAGERIKPDKPAPPVKPDDW